MVIYAKSNGETLEEHVNKMLNLIDSAKFLQSEEKSKCKISAIFHDVGKATTRFQRLLQGDRTVENVRHEVLSAIIYYAHTKLNGEEFDPKVFLAIIFHHKPSLVDLDFDLPKSDEVMYEEIVAFLKKYVDVKYTPKELKEEVEKFVEKEGEDADMLKESKIKKLTKRVYKRVEGDVDTLFYVGLLRQIDHLASAGFDSFDYVEPKVTELFRTKYKFRPHQKAMFKADEDFIILEAPTGSGKTEASLLYAEKKAKNGERILYVINSRASLNALYKRLGDVYGKDRIALDYSGSVYSVVEAMEDDGEIALMDLSSLKTLMGSMAKQLKLTTFAQLLKMTFETKYLPQMIAETRNAVVIFDEIQMVTDNEEYMRHLKALLELLRQNGAKIVIMSATIPEEFIEETGARRITCLEECGAGKIYHKLKILPKTIDEVEFEVRDEKVFIDGHEVERPVLIIVNTVKRAIETYKRLSGRKILLHSRFKQKDRREKERGIVENYSDYDFIVTTQVVEASVDMDAGTLVSEVAPIPSVVQRLGRANRKGKREIKGYNAFIVDVEDSLPYSDFEIGVARRILKKYDGQFLSKIEQYRMTKEFYDKTYRKTGKVVVDLRGYLRKNVTLRTKEFYRMFESVNVILSDDFEELKGKGFKEVFDNSISVQEWIVEGKKATVVGEWKGFLIVDGEYSEELGLTSVSKGDEVI